MHALGTTALTKLWELIKASFARGGGSNGVYYIEGASTTEGAWLGSHAGITGYYAGLMVAYKPDVAGSSDGTTLNINGLGAVPVVRNASSAITTHYGVNSVVSLVYTKDSGTAYWKCVDYDSDKKVSQYSTTTSASYPLLFKYASGTSSTSTTTNYVRYGNKLYCNPSKGTITATTFVGALTGNASTATKATQDGNGNVIADTYATKEEASDSYSLPTASASTLGGVKIGSNLSISSGVLSVPAATGSSAGVTVVYPAASCTTFSSDSGTVTPLAVQKGAKQFAITRPTSSTNKAITRYSNATGDVQNSKVIIEDVTNTKDTSKTAQVIAIPAEGGKKMVYGYCTDQIDGTSFIGGVFDASATSYPYNAGLAIGGTSGNLLWKGQRVLDNSDLTTIQSSLNTKASKTEATASAAGLMSAADKSKLDGIAVGSTVTGLPTVLYSNATGTTGTVTLSSSAANFTFLDIIFTHTSGNVGGSVRVYSPNGKTVDASTVLAGTSGWHALYTNRYAISGTTITPSFTYRVSSSLNGTQAHDSNGLSCVAVIGYK